MYLPLASDWPVNYILRGLVVGEICMNTIWMLIAI